MSVQFDNTHLNDYGRPQLVENAFRVYGNWSGIHDYQFRDRHNGNQSVASTNWQGDGQFINVPNSFFIEYEIDSIHHGIRIQRDEGDYIFGLDQAGSLVGATLNGGILSYLFTRPIRNAPPRGKVSISVIEKRFSDDELDVWITASMWINQRLIGSMHHFVGATSQSGTQVAPAAETGTVAFDNIRVPQLTQFAEWTSLDPGEAPMGGLQRATDGMYIKFFVRFDGSLYAWTSEPVDSAHTFTDPERYVKSTQYDRRQLFTHVRMLGGYAQAEYIRTDLIRTNEHRFVEINNPYILTNAECYETAQREIKRMEERSLIESISTIYTPLLEPEDRITTSMGDRLVTSVSWKFGPATVDQELEGRLYTGYG